MKKVTTCIQEATLLLRDETHLREWSRHRTDQDAPYLCESFPQVTIRDLLSDFLDSLE